MRGKRDRIEWISVAFFSGFLVHFKERLKASVKRKLQEIIKWEKKGEGYVCTGLEHTLQI